MSDLSKQQACQLLIEQEIEAGLAEGKSKYAIGKEISGWIAKLFDAHIKPNTITVRAHRVEKKLMTNVIIQKEEEPERQEPSINTADQVAQLVTEIKEKTQQINEKAKEVKQQKRKEPDRIGEEFRMAWEGLFLAVKNEIALKWKTTDKAVAIQRIHVLLDILER